MVELGISSANTASIMTWKQVIVEEHMSNVVPATKSLYQWIGEHSKDGVTTVDGKRIYIYEVHDGKMIYSFTDNSK